MSNKGRCEFYGKIKIVESTTFIGLYCRKCHEMNIKQSKDAIKEIRKS